jgi:hypothetical protein
MDEQPSREEIMRCGPSEAVENMCCASRYCG